MTQVGAPGSWPGSARCRRSVADQAQRGIQRVCDRDSLVVGFLAHTGLTLDDEPSS